MIRLEDYRWKFDGGDHWTLDGVNLDVAPGECVLLAGPSGAGKSTLVLAIAALLRSRHAGTAGGRLSVAGSDITEASPQAVAGTVAIVQQNPDVNFATLSVEDEVAFALENQCVEPAKIAATVDYSLRLLDLEALRKRRLSTLSEGQKQRVALAAALASKPKVLILDEPTANLDPDGTRDVLQALGRLIENEDMTVLIAEQRLHPFAALRPRVVVLDGGKVAGDYDWSAAEEMRGPFGRDPNLAERPRRRPDASSARVIVEELTVERDNTLALDGVSLAVGKGEIVGLMGVNGSGKSTLLLALMGLIPIQGGRVIVSGTDVRSSCPYDLGRRAGFVLQNPDHQLFADSVKAEALFAAENFECARPVADRRAMRLLEQAGLSLRVEDHPYRLSYGQKRRLNVIASVLHDVKLLLLDEPFVGQDERNAAWLISTIKEMTRSGLGVIMVVHDPYLAQACCDRIVFLKSGRVVMAESLPQAWERLDELGFEAYLPGRRRQRNAIRSG